MPHRTLHVNGDDQRECEHKRVVVSEVLSELQPKSGQSYSATPSIGAATKQDALDGQQEVTFFWCSPIVDDMHEAGN